MTNQKNKTTTKTKQTTTTTKNPKRNSQRQKQQQKKKEAKQNITKQKKETHSIFPNDFSHAVYLFPHLKLLSTIHLRYCHFFLKAVVFIELFKAISFSILLTFRISAIRLFIFMNFFSLDL